MDDSILPVSESSPKPLQSRNGSLSLLMPNSTEIEEFDKLAYHQKKFSDELGSSESLNFQNSEASSYAPAEYSSLLNLDQYYRTYPSHHDSYPDIDPAPSHWHEPDYPLSDIGEYNHERPASLNSFDPQIGYGSIDLNRDSIESNSNINASGGRSRVITGAVTPQSRHARRLYVGGLTISHCDEESIKSFLNSVICNALGDEPDTTYILSIYVNQQKCFAFIELNSIELTSACLDLDGILYQNNPLKILRANEYKPELLPPPLFAPIKLNLSGLLFGATNHSSQGNSSPSFNQVDPQSDLLIKYCSLNTVQRGSIVIVGFPYDDIYRRGPLPPANINGKVVRGCALSPRAIRSSLRKFQSGPIINPEFAIDLSQLKIFDVGDIQGGLSPPEAFKSLADIIAEIVQRGATPFVIGGASDIVPNIAAGMMMVASNIGVMNVNASLDASLLDDSRFYSPRVNYGSKLNCEGRYVQFAAQGSASTVDQSRIITERGGKIMWYNKDLRNRHDINNQSQSAPQSPTSISPHTTKIDIAASFKHALHLLNTQDQGGPIPVNRSICACISMSSLSSAYFPAHHQLRSTGLSADDAMDMAFALGKDKNVMVASLNDFNVDIEEPRSSRLVVDFMYNFFMGFASRLPNLQGGRLSAVQSTVNSKNATPRTNVMPGNRASPQNVPVKMGNPNSPGLPVPGNHMSSMSSGYGNGLPPYPGDNIPGNYNPNNPSNFPRNMPAGSPPFYAALGSNYDGVYGSQGPPYNSSGFSSPGGNIHGAQYPSYENYTYPPPTSSSRPGSKGESPVSYQSGYTSNSVHTNSRPGSKNESPTTHPSGSSSSHLPHYY